MFPCSCCTAAQQTLGLTCVWAPHRGLVLQLWRAVQNLPAWPPAVHRHLLRYRHVCVWVALHRCTAHELCASVPYAAEFLTAALNVLGAVVPSKLGEVRTGVDRVNLSSRTSKGLAPLAVLNPPSLSSTLSSLTSRWMMQGVCACRNASPSAI